MAAISVLGCTSNQPSLEKIVDETYNRLTFEEKVAQLCGIRPPQLMEDGKFSIEKCRELIPNGIGHICQLACTLDMDADGLREFIQNVQDFLMNETPSGVPAIIHDESITGIAAKGATVYPQQLGVACSWDTDLAYKKTVETAETMRDLGFQLALSPMVDVIRTAHWQRLEESYGEDGYLSAVMGKVFVQGLQSKGFKEGVAATTKHFLGYGGAGTLPWKELYEEVLFPHEVIIREAGSKSLMTCYDKFRDEYAVSSNVLLKHILRGYLQYDGIVVSDYLSISHSGESSDRDFLKKCAEDALNAGNDLEFPDPEAYVYIPELIAEGRVSEATFETAVKRALMLKARAGLLDKNPVLYKAGPLDLDPEAHRNTAYRLASESMVLLKNNGVLPLSEPKKIALVGPNANTYWCMLGDYTFQSMQAFWQQNVVDPSCLKIDPLLDALKSRVNGEVSYERGCDWSTADEVTIASSGDPRAAYLTNKLIETVDPTDWKAAMELASKSDVVIAALGENPALCGENRIRKGIRLPGDQEQFLKELIATGKPVVLVMFGGRPQVIDEVADGCAAILQAWYPGEEGAAAVADILTGRVNPSAKLCVSYPKTESRKLFGYNTLDEKEQEELIAYPFGYGLSYSSYAYSDIQVQAEASTEDEWISASCKVTNTSDRDGEEVVQLYVSPASGEPLKPIQLKGFSRISLKAGETKEVQFKIAVDQLAWWSEDALADQDITSGNSSDEGWTISPGAYLVRIGASSKDLPLEGTCTLSGPVVKKALRDNLLSKAE